jgi:predicted DNA-binding transcriptional regulator
MPEALDVVQLWKDIEDNVVPSLGLSAQERALYYHLLRHSHLMGRSELRSTVGELAYQAGFSWSSTRDFLRKLARKGCVRMVSRGNLGMIATVLLPSEILGNQPRPPAPPLQLSVPANGVKDRNYREKIFDREHGNCFYCLRILNPTIAVLDHIIPQSKGGDDSPTNVVACCHECNLEKGVQSASDFLRLLYRTSRLTATELDDRLAALAALQHADSPAADTTPTSGAAPLSS